LGGGDVSTASDESVSETAEDNLEAKVDAKHWGIEFIPELYILETGNEPLRMFRELKAFGQLETKVNVDKVPDFDELAPESCYLSWNFVLDLDIEKEESKIKIDYLRSLVDVYKESLMKRKKWCRLKISQRLKSLRQRHLFVLVLIRLIC